MESIAIEVLAKKGMGCSNLSIGVSLYFEVHNIYRLIDLESL